MPPYEQFTKDFAKHVFGGDKSMMKNRDVLMVCVTKFDELSVKNLYNGFMQLEGVNQYFPDSYPRGRVCDREFMFNIVNTLHEDVVTDIIQHALRQRHILNEDFQKKESILISDHWKKEFESLPLKVSVSYQFTNTNVAYRKKEGWCICLSRSPRSSWLINQERRMKSRACSRKQRLMNKLLKLKRKRSPISLALVELARLLRRLRRPL